MACFSLPEEVVLEKEISRRLLRLKAGHYGDNILVQWHVLEDVSPRESGLLEWQARGDKTLFVHPTCSNPDVWLSLLGLLEDGIYQLVWHPIQFFTGKLGAWGVCNC